MNVFVYGTLRKGSCRDRRLPGPRVPAVLRGYELHQMAGADFPYITENLEAFVLGELVTVASHEATDVLDRLDRIEGHPVFYTRREVTVEMIGGPTVNCNEAFVEAWTYPMPEHRQRDGGLIPTGDFFDFRKERLYVNIDGEDRIVGEDEFEAFKEKHCPGYKTTAE